MLTKSSKITEPWKGSSMKNKLFLCIRPLVTDTEDGEQQRYVVLSKERSTSNRTISMKASERSSVPGTENFRVSTGRRRRQGLVGGSHKTFSQAIKAVLFEVSLRKSVQERHLRQLMHRSTSNDSQKSNIRLEGSNNETGQPQPRFQGPPISPAPSLSSSNSLTPKKKSIPNKDDSSLDYVMYLILISLFVTMFWGKIFGILCTSIWLYVVPRRRRGDGGDRRSVEDCMIKLPGTEEEMVEYKKRVIMGGLLERNHRRDGERALNF